MRNMKRILMMVLALIMVLGSMNLSVFAADESAQGESADKLTIETGRWISYQAHGLAGSENGYTCRFYLTSESLGVDREEGFCIQPKEKNPDSEYTDPDISTVNDPVLARVCAYALETEVGFFAQDSVKSQLTSGTYEDAAYIIGHMATAKLTDDANWDYRANDKAKKLANALIDYAKKDPTITFSDTELDVEGCYQDDDGNWRQKSEATTYTSGVEESFTMDLPNGVQLHVGDQVQTGTVTINSGDTFWFSAPIDTADVMFSPTLYYITNTTAKILSTHDDNKQDLCFLVGGVTGAGVNFWVHWLDNGADAEKTLALSGKKTLENRDFTEKDNFTFSIKNAADDSVVSTGECDTDGNITFDTIKYTIADIGKTYDYYIVENNGGQTIDGVKYDNSTLKFSVTVGSENGEIVLDQKNDFPGDIVFTNEYHATAAKAALEVKKELSGKTLTEGMFQFQKIECDENGKPLENAEASYAKNDADGKVKFESDTYEAAGTHYYLITEVGADSEQPVDGITYDGMEVLVKVTVTDDLKGQLSAKADYPKDVTFNNTYTTESAFVTFEGTKVLEGKPLTEGEYEFTLSDADGNEIETVTNDADGKILFSEIEYKKPGEHQYTIHEVAGDADGVTYDEKVYTVNVTVTDDGKGKLVADVSCEDKDVVFTNTYKGLGEISVTKLFMFNDQNTVINTSFEVGLFTDAACTQKAVYADGREVENKMIQMNHQAMATVTFDGLEYGTYYVAEIDKDGNALTEGDVTGRLLQGAYKQLVSYQDAKVVINGDNKTADATLITNKFYDEQYYNSGSVTVTKTVTLNGTLQPSNNVYYVALFADPELTEMAEGTTVKAIDMNQQATAFVKFTDLNIGTTYYVAETDAEGNVLKDGDLGIRSITVDNNEVTFENAMDQTVNITNDYASEEYFSTGKLQVNKEVLVGGKHFKNDATFYVTLFSDEALTTVAENGETKAIDMNGEAIGSVTYENLLIGATYYVAETDADGNVVEDGDLGTTEILVDYDKVIVQAKEMQTVTVTNCYDTAEYFSEEESEKSTQTGDDSNMAGYMALMAAALATMGAAAFRRRKN